MIRCWNEEAPEGFVPGNKSGIEWTKKRYWSSVRSIFQQLWGKILIRNESKRIGELGIANWGLGIANWELEEDRTTAHDSRRQMGEVCGAAQHKKPG